MADITKNTNTKKDSSPSRIKTKRSKEKYPALKKNVNSRVRQEYIDYDYLDKLSPEEKAWLNDFSEEYINASVGKQSEADQNRFHNTAELVKDCTDRNNARNRCIYGEVRNKVGNTKLLNYENSVNIIEQEYSRDEQIQDVENAMIDKIDDDVED